MVVSREQQAEDKMLNELAAMVKKLTSGMETLNGVQTMAVATMIKEIAQRNSISVSTRRHSADVKKETDLGQETLKVKKELKAEDQYLVRLRHKLNMVQEKEHGAQVRRNINLRHNMDNFNDALNNVKKAITGGAGFQNAIGTTVQKMAGMTRSYQELEIANKKFEETVEQLQLKTSTVNEFDGKPDSADKKNAEDALKIAQSAHQSAQEGVIAATKPAQGTQGMFKPMFEKLSKLGDFLGKKAVPIGIGIGVAGILMSIIVKSFSASPLFAAMMKMMKFMVTLILMPIGTFFGALLRPILILLLRKFIIPFYSNWMPKMMAWGTALGNWLTGQGGQKSTAQPIPTELVPTNEQLDKEAEERYVSLTERIWNGLVNGIWDQITKGNVNVSTLSVGSIVMPKAFADDTEYVPTEEDVSVPIDDPFHTSNLPTGDPNDTRTNEERLADGLDGKVISTSPTTIPFDRTKENTQGDMFPWLQGGGKETQNDYQQTREEIARLEAEELARKEQMAADQKKIDEQLAKIERDKHVRQAAEMAAERAAAVAKTLARSNAIFAAQKSNSELGLGQYSSANNGQTGITPERVDSINPNNGKVSRITNAGISEGAYEKASASKGHVNLSSSNKGLKPETIALLKSMGVAGYAQGFDGMINSPTLFMAGEAGAEHVKVTPNGQGGGGGNITVNIQNMNAGDDDLRKLKKTILEVIQQSTNNRGRL